MIRNFCFASEGRRVLHSNIMEDKYKVANNREGRVS